MGNEAEITNVLNNDEKVWSSKPRGLTPPCEKSKFLLESMLLSNHDSSVIVIGVSYNSRSIQLFRIVRLVRNGLRNDAAEILYLMWCQTNLVDPASSHMLVSKIKPCMS